MRNFLLLDNMRTALFPGSFDPFTLGHMDILRSALKMFDKVIVAVGYNSAKSGFFTPELRVRIIRDFRAHERNAAGFLHRSEARRRSDVEVRQRP